MKSLKLSTKRIDQCDNEITSYVKELNCAILHEPDTVVHKSCV